MLTLAHRSLQRVLYSKQIDNKAPTAIIFGGIHGNEPAGVLGLERVIDAIEKEPPTFTGNFYALTGNINALQKNIRFEAVDLNRIWTSNAIAKASFQNPEEAELLDLYETINYILTRNSGPFYFVDLHTTSAYTAPFITISDSINNRRFSKHFKLPTILGIEEYLDGPLLTYLNEFGHVSLGFEAGQHQEVSSIQNCEYFIWRVLAMSRCIPIKELPSALSAGDNWHSTLKGTFYEIEYRHHLDGTTSFQMIEGFKNFDMVSKGQTLAMDNEVAVKAPLQGQIFMPLYQNQGDDGFFIINRISKFWLYLSTFVRKLKLDQLLRLLPGIRQHPTHKHTLIVNPKTAAFLATEIFHLFGYRRIIKKGNKLHFIKRDRPVSPFKD